MGNTFSAIPTRLNGDDVTADWFNALQAAGANLESSGGAATTATAGGTTALTNASLDFQQFTGTANQSVTFPDSTTVLVGRQLFIANRSTGIISVYAHDGTTLLLAVPAGNQALFTCLSIGTTNGTWDAQALTLLRTGDSMSGALSINGSADAKQLIVKANATQTSNLQEWQDHAGATLASVDATGEFHGNVSGSAASFTGELSGDVTGTQGATTIPDGTVTNAKMANVSGHTYKGNNTGSSAAPADITSAQLLADVSPLTTKGDFLTFDGTSNVRKAIGADGTVPVADSAQTTGWSWKTLSTGSGQGNKNYISNYNFETNLTTAWSLFNTTVSGSYPTGTITTGAASLTTFATTATNPLAGTYSLEVGTTSGTAWASGQGIISDAFTIDIEDQAKVMGLKLFYKVTAGASNLNWSGTTANNLALAVYAVDGTNAGKWIQPSGSFNFVQTGGVGCATGEFQTFSDTTQYRVAILNVNGTAAGSTGATTLMFDDIFCGPGTIAFGPAVTDWNTWNYTLGGGSVKGTVSFDKAEYRQVGDSIECRLDYKQTVGGSTGGSLASFSLPSGLTFDSNKLNASSSGAGTVLGTAWAVDSTGKNYVGAVIWLSSNTVAVQYDDDGGTTNHVTNLGTSPLNFGAVLDFSFRFTAPIVGWSSNTAMSADSDTRVCDFSGTKGSTQAVTGSVTDISFTSVKDSHGAWNGSQFIAPVSGDYVVSSLLADNGSGTYSVVVYVNGVSTRTLFEIVAGNLATGCALIPGIKAGDTISIRSGSTATIAALGSISIFRLTGPAVVAASETVAARYSNTAGSTLTKSTTNIVPFATKDYDTHGAWNGTTFTCPISGKYKVCASLLIQTGSTWAAADFLEIDTLHKGSTMSSVFNIQQASHSTYVSLASIATVQCFAGDTIQIQANPTKAATGNVTLNTGANNNWVTIERIGN